jgi:hypothetical protein
MRSTIEFQTPGRHIIVLNAYLTGREARELKALIFKSMKVDLSQATTGNVGLGDVDNSFLIEQEKAALGYLLVSVVSVTPRAR